MADENPNSILRATQSVGPVTTQHLANIKSEIFGHLDEPNWHKAQALIQKIPPSPALNRLQRGFDDLNKAYKHGIESLPEEDRVFDDPQEDFDRLHHEVEDSLDELAEHHGVEYAPNPNEE